MIALVQVEPVRAAAELVVFVDGIQPEAPGGDLRVLYGDDPAPHMLPLPLDHAVGAVDRVEIERLARGNVEIQVGGDRLQLRAVGGGPAVDGAVIVADELRQPPVLLVALDGHIQVLGKAHLGEVDGGVGDDPLEAKEQVLGDEALVTAVEPRLHVAHQPQGLGIA